MPVVNLNLDRFKEILGKEISQDLIIEKLPYLGLDIEDIFNSDMRIEYNPNRLDYSSDYGIARGLKGLLDIDLGCPTYNVSNGSVEVIVDPSVQRIRPYIVSAIIKNLNLTTESIKQIISMQEDIHNSIGRRRRKVSIGIHNLDVITPPILYIAKPSTFKFRPLDENEEMSINEINKDTKVGQSYSYIIDGYGDYPILLDDNQQTLSFPPIINSELTRVTTSTSNLFIDVTATDPFLASDALAILTTTFNDAGGLIESVNISYPDSILTMKSVTKPSLNNSLTLPILTPDLSPIKMKVNVTQINNLLGLSLDNGEISKCLSKSRIDTIISNDNVEALIPRYRIDIMHPVDLVEEVALGYGIDQFTSTLPSSYSLGKYSNEHQTLSHIRDIATRFGLIEIMSFNLSNSQNLNSKLRRSSNLLKIMNSKSSDHSILRNQLISSLLETFSLNIHSKYPQKIFEVGKTFFEDPNYESGIREEYHLAVGITHKSARYTEINSILQSLLKQAFNVNVITEPISDSSFIDGRSASINVKEDTLGIIGEIHPESLSMFNLRNPVSLFELNLQSFL